MKCFRTFAIFFATVALSTAGARADDGVSGSLGLSLAPLIGEHVESGSIDHPAPIPIPIGQVSLRYKPLEIFFESLPGSPAIPQDSSVGEALTTHLAFLNAVARVYASSDRFWAGGGEVVYNQSSTYVSTDRRFGNAVSVSRVAGGRYEFACRNCAARTCNTTATTASRDGVLADRNTGLLPYATFAIRFGK